MAMIMSTQQTRPATFKVLDAFDAPHGGRILRLQLEDGDAPGVRALKDARLIARSPAGDERRLRVQGFPTFGGRPSDERLARTGRVDVHVRDDDGGGAGAAAGRSDVGLRWDVSLAD
jgi:hypothetical protein